MGGWLLRIIRRIRGPTGAEPPDGAQQKQWCGDVNDARKESGALGKQIAESYKPYGKHHEPDAEHHISDAAQQLDGFYISMHDAYPFHKNRPLPSGRGEQGAQMCKTGGENARWDSKLFHNR